MLQPVGSLHSLVSQEHPKAFALPHFNAVLSRVAEVTGFSVSGLFFGCVLLHWIIAKQLNKYFSAPGGSLSVRQQLG